MKGVGFANVYISNEDIFIHTHMLIRSGLVASKAVNSMALRVLLGKCEKKTVLEICHCEIALDQY